MNEQHEVVTVAEVRAAADRCAALRLTGREGSPLPELMSSVAVAWINHQPHRFALWIDEALTNRERATARKYTSRARLRLH